MCKTYTHTEEGKRVLWYISQVASISGLEVYKCEFCDELYGSTPELAKYDDKCLCGICQEDIERENRDSHGLENTCEEDEE
jgi:hypothetical protein